jgi:UDP-N-acetylmuramate--alanine ligase
VRGSDWLASEVRSLGRQADYVPLRSDIADKLVDQARSGDRILIMGARDDTLIDFAHDVLQRLPSKKA